MGLLDSLWGQFRNSAAGEQLGSQLLSAIAGGSGGQASQANALPDLIHRFERAGLADVVQSWVSNEQTNKPISPEQVHSALGEGEIGQLASRTGISKESLLQELAAVLPQLIDRMTPNGQVPSSPGTVGGKSTPAQVPGEAESPPASEANPAAAASVNRTDPTEPTQS
jgi:uncharacterized protein YidB (DUF937 family)